MLKESGIVIEVSNQFATVQIKRTSYCGQCATNKGCGTASLSSILGQKYTQVKVINHGNMKVGDRVIISLEEQALLKSSIILYLLPLLGLFVLALSYEMLAAIGEWPHYESLTILAGLLGLFIGLKLAKRIISQYAKELKLKSVMLQTK